MPIFQYFPGRLPVILSIPHAGTYVPEPLLARFTPKAQQLPDTDWHLDKLYDFAQGLGIHVLIATHSRYVIDLNRAPDGASLYPGQFTTGLCPETLFDGSPIYQEEQGLTKAEIESRIQTYWQPYHQKLLSLITSLNQEKGLILFDAHSILSNVPRLFEGTLPSLNIGTDDGKSASLELTNKIADYCQQTTYSTVINGRFKGGYITRQYGNPAQGVETIQLEMIQSNYMSESFPFTYQDKKAKKCQQMLMGLLSLLVQTKA